MSNQQDPPATDDVTPAADDQLKALQEELQKFKDLAARAQADLQNAKARVERESADIRQFANAQLLEKLLPTLDNFQRAFAAQPNLDGCKEACPELAEWAKGVSVIEGELMRQLTDVGLTRMSSLGQKVDHMRHEPLMTGPGNEGEVIEVLEEGYEFRGKVLRTAKVKVGDGTAS